MHVVHDVWHWGKFVEIIYSPKKGKFAILVFFLVCKRSINICTRRNRKDLNFKCTSFTLIQNFKRNITLPLCWFHSSTNKTPSFVWWKLSGGNWHVEIMMKFTINIPGNSNFICNYHAIMQSRFREPKVIEFWIQQKRVIAGLLSNNHFITYECLQLAQWLIGSI